MSPSKACILSCGVFAEEVRFLMENKLSEFAADLEIIDSRLHMDPLALKTEMADRLSRRDTLSELRYVLLFGDCHPHMKEMCSEHHMTRAGGVNCGEILLGSKTYRELRKSGAFLLFPEWAGRWHEIFTIDLGLSDPAVARSFMKEHHRKFIYLDTGVLPIPQKDLDDIRTFFELPVEILPVSLDFLEDQLRQALLSPEEG